MPQNPLLSHLLRKAGPPALWLTGVFAAIVFAWVIGSMQPALSDMLSNGTPIPESETWLFFAALLVLLGAPVMVGVNAAVFTGRHADPDNLKKLKLAKTSRADLAWGYFLAALHRMRVPLALSVGLAPALAISITEFMLGVYQMFHPGCVTSGVCAGIAGLPDFDVTHWLVINGLLAAGVVGFSALAASVGTWAALIWKRSVVAPGMVVVGMTAATAGFAALLSPSEGASLPVALAAGLGPYVLAFGLVWLAGRGGGGG